ncbi:hypothetical protein SAMN05216233_12546 [Desulfoluna spongiiphila]|uniref:Uncharacterized protein n=1 Tax=Desulfoluna spongiiphila TaxID=419481 RepID=A0A1G5J5U2_9BACT|nr:hypothetical protein SAMN05216233_12546 [Desulfoluna spongiiphila]
MGRDRYTQTIPGYIKIKGNDLIFKKQPPAALPGAKLLKSLTNRF